MMGSRKRWNRWIQIILLVVVIAELACLFTLGRLDGSYILPSLRSSIDKIYDTTHTFPGFEATVTEVTASSSSSSSTFSSTSAALNRSNCEKWLLEADQLPYKRNFSVDPVVVSSGEVENWDKCGVACVFKNQEGKLDGVTRRALAGPPWRKDGTSHVLRSMESASYYPENDLETAHRSGYDIVMTTNLASDVPVGYFSWAEYNIMAPVEHKTEEAHAAAFISNCAAHNFRLEALEDLKTFKVDVHSFGKCYGNRQAGSKLETLKRYMFSLAFENSNELDYVTEKFWQSLVAGSVPVVIGAPNIEDFAPAPNAFLHIRTRDDVGRVASQMRYLASNKTAYNETLQWKYEGPSKSFKALVDMAAVHSSCRLCIHLATLVRMDEEYEMGDVVNNRPCQCKDDASGDVFHHLYVRERGRFEMESIFLKSGELTIAGLEAAVLEKFRSINHVPVWWTERPEVIRGDGVLRIYRIHPVGLTQRDALYSVYFRNDEDVKGHLEENPCSKLEVIFV